MTDNIVEVIQQLAVPRYAPRIKPTPIPGAAWNEAPLFCLKLNDEWVSHVLGVMTALDQPDTWQGTEEEIFAVRQQVNEVMAAFMQMCEEPMLEFRVEDCDLQYRENEADEWHSLGNVCGADGADGSPGTDGQDGADGRDGEDGAPGTPGTDGVDGTNGTNGVDGQDGECDCDRAEDINRDTENFDGQACAVAAGLMEYLITKNHDALSSIQSGLMAAKVIADIVGDLFEAVPVFGAIVQAVKDYAENVASGDVGDLIALTYTTDFKEWVQCQIYCNLKDITGDVVTYDNVLAACNAMARAAAHLPPGGAFVSFYGQVFSLCMIALDFNLVYRHAVIHADERSDDCLTLCTDCPTECNTRSVGGTDLNGGLGVNTGLYYVSGDIIDFTATGLWDIAQTGNTNANGYPFMLGSLIKPDSNVGTLLGRIGTGGAWFAIGTSATVTLTATGRLYLIANDIPDPAAFEPNTGSQSVEICLHT